MDIRMAGFLGALVSFCLILLFQTALVQLTRSRAKKSGTNRKVRFMDLVITCEDDSYSLSRLQMYLWTVAIVTGYWAVFAATFAATGIIPQIPDSLYMLIGVNFANAVAATAIDTYKSTPPDDTQQAQTAATQQPEQPVQPQQPAAAVVAAKTPPDFIMDIFFDSPSSLDLPRTQMFIWTVVSLGVYVIALVNSFASAPGLPNIPAGLVALMGISNGAYLGAKAAKRPC